ncbi:MAG: glycosyltransferase [Bacillota bacterium]
MSVSKAPGNKVQKHFVKEAPSVEKGLAPYAQFVGEEKIEELLRLGKELQGIRVQQVNSARVGGGVAEMLQSLIPIEQALGLSAQWDVITGDYNFFKFTKTLHNFLQGRTGALDILGSKMYWDTNRANSRIIDHQADMIIIHDPQPAGLITYVPPEVRERQKWVWRCHIQLDTELRLMMDFLRPLIELYDATIFSSRLCTPRWRIAPFVVLPYIDPLSDKNRQLTARQIRSVLDKYGIENPAKKPLITLVSRFDPFKGHVYAVDAFREVRKKVPCQLLLVGGTASDDPENQVIFDEIIEKVKGVPDIHLINLPAFSHVEINAFQWASTIILQPSLKEGFGLTVTEGMWKGKPVIGGNVGGIPSQIADGYNGFLVTPGEKGVPEMADRIMHLIHHPTLAEVIGRRARETVRERFLITRGLWDELMLIKSVMKNHLYRL